MVAFNYARELEIVKRYNDAIEIAEYARKFALITEYILRFLAF